jgi:hypothetical protein
LVKHAQDSAGLISSPLLIIYLHVFGQLNFFAVFLVWVCAAHYEESKDPNSNATNAARAEARADYKGSMAKLFEKGQSRRLWAELYKVLDSSDVVVQVLDIRDPMGTRCKRIGMADLHSSRIILLLSTYSACLSPWRQECWVALHCSSLVICWGRFHSLETSIHSSFALARSCILLSLFYRSSLFCRSFLRE